MNKIMSPIFPYKGSIALIAGALSAFGFAPHNIWPISLASLAILIALLVNISSARQSFRIAWLWGVGHFCISLQWIAFSFTFQDALPHWMGYLTVFGLALYLAIYPAIGAASAHYIYSHLRKLSHQKPIIAQSRLSALPFIMILSATWIISEWLRSVMLSGFGWNPISASMIDTALAAFLPWIGSYGVSAALIITAGIAMMMMRQLSWAHIKARNYWGLAILPLLFFLFYPSIGNIGPISSTRTASDITVVQPNIGQDVKYSRELNQIKYQKLAELSTPLPINPNKPRIIFWSEDAIPDYLESGYPRQAYFDNIGGSAEGALAALGTLLGPDDILLTGATRLEWNGNALLGARNSVIGLSKNQITERAQIFGTYDKSHLLPLGEYVPLRSVLEPLGVARFVPGSVDFWPGDGPDTITIPASNSSFGGVKIGVQICYELVFSGRVTNRDDRPDFIFSPSNDAWFGPWGPPQHEAQGRLRAIEEGLPVIRVTPTGVSAIIYKDGRIGDQIAQGIAGRIDAAIPPAGPPTFFAQHGNIIPLSLALLILFSTIISTIAIGRARR